MTVRRDSALFATEQFPLQNHLKPFFTVVWLFIFFFLLFYLEFVRCCVFVSFICNENKIT